MSIGVIYLSIIVNSSIARNFISQSDNYRNASVILTSLLPQSSGLKSTGDEIPRFRFTLILFHTGCTKCQQAFGGKSRIYYTRKAAQ
jgi:hypothetical protein